jgi:hypothetical protein
MISLGDGSGLQCVVWPTPADALDAALKTCAESNRRIADMEAAHRERLR